MTEPALTTTAGHALAGTGIMVAGIATGLPADLIFPSFVGALWALKTAEQGGPWARVLQVVAGIGQRQQRERVHLHDLAQLGQLVQGGAFEVAFQRAHVGAAGHVRERFLAQTTCFPDGL